MNRSDRYRCHDVLMSMQSYVSGFELHAHNVVAFGKAHLCYLTVIMMSERTVYYNIMFIECFVCISAHTAPFSYSDINGLWCILQTLYIVYQTNGIYYCRQWLYRQLKEIQEQIVKRNPVLAGMTQVRGNLFLRNDFCEFQLFFRRKIMVLISIDPKLIGLHFILGQATNPAISQIFRETKRIVVVDPTNQDYSTLYNERW